MLVVVVEMLKGDLHLHKVKVALVVEERLENQVELLEQLIPVAEAEEQILIILVDLVLIQVAPEVQV
jgi:hypothetical protein